MTETRTSTYFLTYQVVADGWLAAIVKAGGMLRKDVRVIGEAEAEQSVPGWWDVTFLVAEDYKPAEGVPPVWPGDLPEGLDPITQAKGDHARFGL